MYELPILATDGGGKLDWATVRLMVTDVNDNAPVFQLPEYTTTVYANLSVNYVFLKVELNLFIKIHKLTVLHLSLIHI